MIEIFGIHAVVENLAALSLSSSKKRKEFRTQDDLRDAYRGFLRKKLSRVFEEIPDDVHVISSPKTCKRVKKIFLFESELDDLQQSTVVTEIEDEGAYWKKSLVCHGLSKLASLSNVHRRILGIVVPEVVILPSRVATGGSTSGAIGTVWINPKDDHSIYDISEFFVHELTHQLMFADELRYGHYYYNNILPASAWVKSAILCKNRPMDKVLHSIVVATELLLFRENIKHMDVGWGKAKIHPPQSIMLKNISNSIKSVEEMLSKHGERSEMLKPRARHIISVIKEKIKAFETL